MTKEEQQQVAKTIYEQLGGRGFGLMVGAKNLLSHSDQRGALSLRFKGSRKANYLKVTLTDRDDYTLEFCKVGRYDFDKVETCEGIYADNLQEVFRRVTGLETRFPKIIMAGGAK
jgi:hypothetical protein